MRATITERLLYTFLRATYLSFAVAPGSVGGRITTLALQTRELGHREVKQLARGHPAGERWHRFGHRRPDAGTCIEPLVRTARWKTRKQVAGSEAVRALAGLGAPGGRPGCVFPGAEVVSS